jgi:hypothetical protein
MCGDYEEVLCLNDSSMSVWENIVWQKTAWVEQCLPDSEEPQQGWLRMLILHPFFIVYREVVESVGRVAMWTYFAAKMRLGIYWESSKDRESSILFLEYPKESTKACGKETTVTENPCRCIWSCQWTIWYEQIFKELGFVLVNRLHEMNGWSYGRRPVICRSILLQKFIELLATWEFSLTKHDA